VQLPVGALRPTVAQKRPAVHEVGADMPVTPQNVLIGLSV
jgi:hypothetical protein